MEQLKTIGRELAMSSQGGFGKSKEFLDLVKSIGESRSKAEEDRILLQEIEMLKRRLGDPDIPKRKMKEYIIRLVYVEMLGHDASFGYIHAVKMTHDDNLILKRTGYLAVSLFLNEDHDLIILIVNTIQKDLKSDNYLVVCAALSVVCRLINEETIPAVLQQVVELIGHPKEAVRKKAVMALYHFHRKSPSSVSHLLSNFRKRLCDNDPGVMGATLCPLFDLVMIDPSSYKDLVVSFVNILKQVAEHRLPKAYEYHQIPAPFIQIRLLKILSLLGSNDKQASEHMYTVVGELLKKCDPSTNIGNAVLHECVCCVSSIYPNPKLLEVAANVIAMFLKSEDHNLKYLGIDALGRLIKSSPEIGEQHQLSVIDCLEDPDDTLKRKTFELLYKMTKYSNVEVIVSRMLDYMTSISDTHYKKEIASRCVELAEQFAPSNHWFIQAMNRVFEHAGVLLNVNVAHNLMRIIAEEGFGADDDGSSDVQLRSFAVESYLDIIREPKLPSIFVQVICWVLGEYGTADGRFPASYVTGKLCDAAEAYSNDETIKAYAVSALMKIYSSEIAAGRKVEILPECQSLIGELTASHSTDLQQRAYELQAVIRLDAHVIGCILPLDSSCKEIKMDRSLSFLDGYVQKSLGEGAKPYIPEKERSDIPNLSDRKNQYQNEPSSHALRFEAYELPRPPPPPSNVPCTQSALIPELTFYQETQQAAQSPSSFDVGPSEVKLRLDGVQKRWGKPSSTPSSVAAPSAAASQPRLVNTANSSGRKVVEASRRPQAEVSSEKQKLASSLFGTSSILKMASKTPPRTAASFCEPVVPPPDLLDLSDPVGTNSGLSVDPFKQLEGLLGLHQDSSSSVLNLVADGRAGASFSPLVQSLTCPNLKDSVEKDARLRRVSNESVFGDLLS